MAADDQRVAVAQPPRPVERLTVQGGAVAAVEVGRHQHLPALLDLQVVPGDRVVLERQSASRRTPDHGPLRRSGTDRGAATTKVEIRRIRRRPAARSALVAVVVRLVGAADRDAEVGRLVGGQLGQVDAEGGQVEAGDLLVEVLGEDVDLLGGELLGPA